MADRKFTLIELHLDGAQIGPAALSEVLPIGESGETESRFESSEEDEAAAADEESGGKGAIGVVVGLVVLVGIALAVRKFRGGEEEEFEEREEPDVVVS